MNYLKELEDDYLFMGGYYDALNEGLGRALLNKAGEAVNKGIDNLLGVETQPNNKPKPKKVEERPLVDGKGNTVGRRVIFDNGTYIDVKGSTQIKHSPDGSVEKRDTQTGKYKTVKHADNPTTLPEKIDKVVSEPVQKVVEKTKETINNAAEGVTQAANQAATKTKKACETVGGKVRRTVGDAATQKAEDAREKAQHEADALRSKTEQQSKKIDELEGTVRRLDRENADNRGKLADEQNRHKETKKRNAALAKQNKNMKIGIGVGAGIAGLYGIHRLRKHIKTKKKLKELKKLRELEELKKAKEKKSLDESFKNGYYDAIMMYLE